jgi:hypothetical protein
MRSVKSGLATVAVVFALIGAMLLTIGMIIKEKNTLHPRPEMKHSLNAYTEQDVRDYFRKNPPDSSLTNGSSRAKTIQTIEFITVRELSSKYRQQIHKLNDPYRRVCYVRFTTVNNTYIWYIFDAKTGEMLASGKRYV